MFLPVISFKKCASITRTPRATELDTAAAHIVTPRKRPTVGVSTGEIKGNK